MTTAVTARDRYLADFEELERHSALQRPSWLAPLRRSAIAHVARFGFPTPKDEDWRYTNLAPLVATPFVPAAAHTPGALRDEDVQRLALGDAGGPRLVFVNGGYSIRHSSRPSLPPGARLTSLAEAIQADGEVIERHLAQHAAWDANVFAALSAAFIQDGAFVHLPADVSLSVPLELLFVATAPGVLAQPRVLIVAGPRSRITVLERYVALTEEAYFTNVVTEIVAGSGATVDHVVVQEQSPAGFHIATVHAALDDESAFTTSSAAFGSRLARATLAVQFRGERARAALRGVYVVGGHQHVDTHVTVDHAVPRCSSQQLYKGVLDGRARAVFNGRILVRPDAQKTDANQTNKHLLLSDTVEVDSKPQLEIFADDVKCTHGAAEGQLAPEALFYLQSRGLGEAAARTLLTYGFAREVLERIEPAPLQAYIERALMARLADRAGMKEIE